MTVRFVVLLVFVLLSCFPWNPRFSVRLFVLFACVLFFLGGFGCFVLSGLVCCFVGFVLFLLWFGLFCFVFIWDGG